MTTTQDYNERSGTTVCSGFLADAINARLAELRETAALCRYFVNKWRNQTYWDESTNSQHKRFRFLREQMRQTRIAEDALKDFITEHRSLMGPEWIGNDHGRLCWGWFLGGRPIDQHYCTQPEGHGGFCQNDKGSWPKGVHFDREWWDRRKSCKHREMAEYNDQVACVRCGMIFEAE